MHRSQTQRVHGVRTTRGKSTRRAVENQEENIPIDINSDPKENLKTILCNISSQSNIPSGRRLGHLNNLVKLLCTREDILENISLKTLLICIKPALVNDVKEVRAACIRVLRYLINDSESCSLFVNLHLDYFVVKCLDISHFNEVERIQTLRLIRKIIHVLKKEEYKSDIIPKSFVSCIVSISSDGADERDRVYRTCLAVLCELAITHPKVFVEYGGLLSLFRAIPECHLYPRISECLLMSLVHVFNHIDAAQASGLVNLDPLFSSYTDLLVERSRSDSDDVQIREEEMHFVACKTAIVSAIRSWSGLTYISQGNGLKSFLSSLSVPNSTTLRGILSVLFEIFYIPEPDWINDFSLALKTANPNVFQDSWRLSNSFIAAEAKSLLPLRCKSRVDILDSFIAVLLSIFINKGLLENLVEVAISANSYASVSSCILLGGVLQLCGELLPQTNSLCTHSNTKTCMHRECLPNLLKRATDKTKTKEERFAAVTAANRLEQIKKIYSEKSMSYSLYLEELLFRSKNYFCEVEDHVFVEDGVTLASSQFSHMPSSSKSHNKSSTALTGTGNGSSFSESLETVGYNTAPVQMTPRKNRSLVLIKDFAEERILAKIKDTNVLITKENKEWKWKAILSVLNNTYENNTSREYLYEIGSNDSVHRFFKRLVFFYLPNSKLFSILELARENMQDFNRDIILAGCRLIRFLLKSSSEGLNLLTTLVGQIVEYLSSEATSSSGYKKSGNSIGTTCSREYFLFLGVLSSDNVGDKILTLQNAYSYFNSLLTDTTHENIIKLLISSLQYSSYGPSREVLRQVLKRCSERCRLYATSFLRCLYRANVPEFIDWGTELISSQLYDKSNAVALEALNIMDEICDEPEYLKVVVNLGPSVLHMGERGAMLVCRFLAYPTRPNYLSDGTYLANELDRWWDSARSRYVEQVEELLNISLTSYEKPTNGNEFVRRSNVKKSKCPVRLPAHLYGELVKYSSGCSIIKQGQIIPKLFNLLNKELSSLKTIYKSQGSDSYLNNKKVHNHLLEIKSCLWGLAHISSTQEGFLLTKSFNVCQILVKQAEESPWYSLRGTCVYCLSLVAQTVKGVAQLAHLHWISVTQKSKNMADQIEELNSDELMNYQYSPSVFLRRNSIISQSIETTKHVKKVEPHATDSTDYIFTVGVNETSPQSPSSPTALNFDKQFISIIDPISEIDDMTPTNSNVSLKGLERDKKCYGSRNLSIPQELDDCNETGNEIPKIADGGTVKIKTGAIASSNTGISAIYNIRETFQHRSSSLSDTFAFASVSDHYCDTDPETSVENISLTKYVGLALPEDIFILFRINTVRPTDLTTISPSQLPAEDLPFLIRNTTHKNNSESKYLMLSENSESTGNFYDTPYIDDLSNSAENHKAIQSEVLKLTAKLGSSIGIRMHETALLTIKEKYPELFNSVTLYNEISEMLSLYNYRLTTRRFIQELFHGIQMDEIYVNAKLELDKYSRQ